MNIRGHTFTHTCVFMAWCLNIGTTTTINEYQVLDARLILSCYALSVVSDVFLYTCILYNILETFSVFMRKGGKYSYSFGPIRKRVSVT
jgi:hypothetical protein